jgi:hypothetical protein
MTTGLDEGPILLEGSLPIGPKADSLALEFAKAEAAAADLPEVLSLTVEGHPGKAQTGEVRYHSIEDSRNMTTISDPSVVSGDELERRLRAFRILRMQIGVEWLDVTRVRPARKPGRFSFRTSDGDMWKAVRFHYLPYAAFRSVRPLLHRDRAVFPDRESFPLIGVDFAFRLGESDTERSGTKGGVPWRAGTNSRYPQ